MRKEGSRIGARHGTIVKVIQAATLKNGVEKMQITNFCRSPQRLELGLQLRKMAKVVTNPGEEQDGAGDRGHDGPRPLGHRLGRQKTG